VESAARGGKNAPRV